MYLFVYIKNTLRTHAVGVTIDHLIRIVIYDFHFSHNDHFSRPFVTVGNIEFLSVCCIILSDCTVRGDNLEIIVRIVRRSIDTSNEIRYFKIYL